MLEHGLRLAVLEIVLAKRVTQPMLSAIACKCTNCAHAASCCMSAWLPLCAQCSVLLVGFIYLLKCIAWCVGPSQGSACVWVETVLVYGDACVFPWVVKVIAKIQLKRSLQLQLSGLEREGGCAW